MSYSRVLDIEQYCSQHETDKCDTVDEDVFTEEMQQQQQQLAASHHRQYTPGVLQSARYTEQSPAISMQQRPACLASYQSILSVSTTQVQ